MLATRVCRENWRKGGQPASTACPGGEVSKHVCNGAGRRRRGRRQRGRWWQGWRRRGRGRRRRRRRRWRGRGRDDEARALVRNASATREKKVATIANLLSAAGVVAVLVGGVKVGVRVGVVLHRHREREVDARLIHVVERHRTRLLLVGEVVWVGGVLLAIVRRGRGEGDPAVGKLFYPELGRDGWVVIRLVRRRLPGLHVFGDQPLTITRSLICANEQGGAGGSWRTAAAAMAARSMRRMRRRGKRVEDACSHRSRER